MTADLQFGGRYRVALNVAAPALLFCLNVFVLGTFAVYRGNAGEFLVGYAQVLSFLLFPCLAVFCILLLPARFIGARRVPAYYAVLFFFAVATYVHGNLLRWPTGVLDGNALNLSLVWRDAVDSLVWLLLAWMVWRYRKWLARQGWKICSALALFQIVGLILVSGDSPTALPSGGLPPERQAHLSDDINVIQIVLDGFQANVFEQLLPSMPGLADDFTGFTFFRDALSSSDVTYLSVPASLTGRAFTNDRPISQYLEESFGGENLYHFLADKGFVIDVASPVRWNEDSSDFTSYYRIPSPYTADLAESTALLLLDLSLFRQVPHFLKASVYRRGTWLISSALLSQPAQQFAHFSHTAFLRDLVSHMSVESDARTYKFIHLLTPHPPFVSNTDCSFTGSELKYSVENFSSQSRCTLLAVRELLNRLKSLGVYDRAVILIYGDHGGGVPFEMHGADGHITTSSDSLRRVWGSPLPLVLVKPSLASGTLNISNQPVALTDIPATVAELLHAEKNPFPGRSMFSVAEDESRVRSFYRSTIHRNEAAAKDRFDNFSRFDVTGSAYDLASWSQEEIDQFPVLDQEKTYRWGMELSFGGHGTYKPFQQGGWSVARSGGITWTDGPEAGLSLPLPEAKDPVRMRVTLKPMLITDVLEQQRVTVSVNGHDLARWELTENRFQQLDLLIPPEILSERSRAEIRFLLPDAAVPSAIGASKDRRRLALAFMSLRFDQEHTVYE